MIILSAHCGSDLYVGGWGVGWPMKTAVEVVSQSMSSLLRYFCLGGKMKGG